VKNVYKIQARKPEGKRSLWKPRHRGEDVIEMNFKGGGCSGVGWIQLAQVRIWWRAGTNW
jgi:hypothetical protein